VNAEDRVAESMAMGRLNELLEKRLSAVQHLREALGCCARSPAAPASSRFRPGG
jgi:hypothetical protein